MPHLDQVVVVLISTTIEEDEGITIIEEEVMVVVELLMLVHTSFHHTPQIRIIKVNSLHHHSFKAQEMRGHHVRYVGRVAIQQLIATIAWTMPTKESTLQLSWLLWQQLQMLQLLKNSLG